MHLGPYVLQTGFKKELRITFGAYRLSKLNPGTVSTDAAHIANQMKALADETRLEIIQMLKREGEKGTQEIIDRFQLSKSAASRHMRQLYSNGVVIIRKDEDGLSKFYRLNPQFLDQMQEMLKGLVG
jgi:DNA-binding transcriptional ArsR family regulator